MFDFYQKRKLRGFIGSRYTQAVLLVLALLIAWSAYGRFTIALEMQERRERVEAEAAALEARKDSLEAQVRYLSDERGIEAEMRRQFDVAKDGEQVVVIVDPQSENEIEPLASSTNEKVPWYQFWR